MFHDGLGRAVRSAIDLRAGGTGAGAPTGAIVQQMTWDRNSRLVGRIDDRGKVTGFEYDALDRVTAEVFADLTRRTTAYDRADNPITTTDALERVVTRQFDPLDRLTGVTVSSPSGVTGTSGQQFEYDGLSRLTRATDTAGGQTAETSFVYDSLSRAIEELQDGLLVASAFAGDGRRTGLTYPGGTALTFSHDVDKRLKSISQSGQAVPVAQWDWIGPGMRPLRRTTANGVVQSFLAPPSGAGTGTG